MVKYLVSTMAQDLLTTYKLGWKTSYYQNTYDSKKDEDNYQRLRLYDNIAEEKRKKRTRTVTLVQFNENCI